MIKKTLKRLNARDKARAHAAAAMPEVKRLVKKFGRTAVGNCLNKIRDYDKEIAKLAALKKEIADRQARLK